MNDPTFDSECMARAIALARSCRSEGKAPKPLVGAVIAKNGKILAGAFRGEMGIGEHAEYTLLERKLKDENLDGAELYTTLEPCTTRNHPKVPCATRITERKIRHVHIGILDPNPDICGKGYLTLRTADIGVSLASPGHARELEQLNRDFLRHIRAAKTRQRTRVRILAALATVGLGAILLFAGRQYVHPEPRVHLLAMSADSFAQGAELGDPDSPLSAPIELKVALLNTGRAAGQSFSLTMDLAPDIQVLRAQGGSLDGYPSPHRVLFAQTGVSIHRDTSLAVGSIEIRLPKNQAPGPIALYQLTGDFEPSRGTVECVPKGNTYAVQVSQSERATREWESHRSAWEQRAWLGRAREIWRISGQSQPQGIATVDDHVFWGVRPWKNGPSIMAATVGRDRIRTLVSSGAQPAAVIAADGAIFWTEPNSGKVMEARPTDIGWSRVRVRAVATARDSPLALAASNLGLYWTSGSNAVWRVAFGGKTALIVAQREQLLHSIVVHQSRVCWGEVITTPQGRRGTVTCESSKGNYETVFSASDLPLALAGDGSNIYVGTRDDGTGGVSYGRVWRITSDGRAAIVADGQPVVTAMEAEPGRIVWLSSDGDVRTIVGNDGIVHILATNQMRPYALVLLKRRVVWTNQGSSSETPDGSVIAVEAPE